MGPADRIRRDLRNLFGPDSVQERDLDAALRHQEEPPVMTGPAPTTSVSGCAECGWLCAAREYHPFAACAIVKEVRRTTGRTVDPMPYLRTIADDIASVGPDRAFRPKEAVGAR